jgi:pimeloyl-ACP methyl ester carboxylesterase
VQGAGVVGNGWRPQVDALAPRFTTIVIDNRGIGASTLGDGPLSIEAMAADTLAVMDAERIDRCHLAGHSMGGLVAQQIALAAPGRVASLALLCTFLRGADGARMTAAMLLTALRMRIGPRAMRRNAFLELIMPAGYLATADRSALARELQPLFGHDLAHQPSFVMRQVRAMARFDASDGLSALGPIPTLVVSASHDRIARPASGRALAAAIPGARYVEVPDAGHAVPIQCAAAVNDLLLDHLLRAAAAPLS